MECPKCKSNISNSSRYCPRCGYLFQNDVVEQHNDFERELLNIYTNKKLLYQNNFSIGFGLFNFAYAFWCRMYYVGMITFLNLLFLIFICCVGGNVIINSMGFYTLLIVFLFLLSISINIYYFLHFNDLYIRTCQVRIHKWLNNQGNMSATDIRANCIKNSKGNYIASILSIVVFVFLVYIFFFSI